MIDKIQMKIFLASACLLLSVAVYFAQDVVEEIENVDKVAPRVDHIFVLTDQNFDQTVTKHSPILVEFYAPWCGHCQRLEPIYVQVAETLHKKQSRINLAKIDATKNEAMTEKFGVKGYPSLKLFLNGPDGKVIDYDGDRDPEGIVQWLDEKTDPNFQQPVSAVLTLTSQNFSDYTSKSEIILVEFYAVWCGHCKKLAPEYEKAARKLRAVLPKPILLAKVDATVEPDLAKKFSVTSYPTFKLFKKGDVFDFEGAREAEGIIQYMLDQSRPALKEIETLEDLEKSISKDDVTIILFVELPKNAKLYESYKKASELHRETFPNVYFTTNEEVAEKLQVKSMNRIAILQPEKFWSKFEPKMATIDGEAALEHGISKFFMDKSVPLVGERTMKNQEKRYAKMPLVVVYFTVNFEHGTIKETQFWRQKVLNVAHKFPKLHFAISDEEDYAMELQEAGLGDSGLDVNVVVFGENLKRYPMSPEKYDEFNEENFEEFLTDFTKGRIKAHIKSQPVPAKDDGPVKVLVGSNIDKIANDQTKDVLIEFYAPWCGHCKAFAPIYEQLARKYKNDKNLLIAKFDATANDVPERFKVRGFPTIYLARAGHKQQPLLFNADRTLEGLDQFLQDSSVVSFGKGGEKTEL